MTRFPTDPSALKYATSDEITFHGRQRSLDYIGFTWCNQRDGIAKQRVAWSKKDGQSEYLLPFGLCREDKQIVDEYTK